MEELNSKKRVRGDSDGSDHDSPEVKKLREDLLDDLDDSEFCTTAGQDLDSFMRSFEEEIRASPVIEVVDVTSESGDSQPELGYLLEASDDELGLPPSKASPVYDVEDGGEQTEVVRVSSSPTEFSDEFWGFDEQIPSYESFDFGAAGVEGYGGNGGEYVPLDGLFDHSDLGFGSLDLPWRPETLPAQ